MKRCKVVTQLICPSVIRVKKAWMIIAIIALVALIGLGVYGYTKIKDLNKKISDQQAQIDELNNKKKTLEDAAAAAAKAATDAAAKAVTNATAGSDEDQVIAAAKNRCEAEVDPSTGKARVFALGTIGSSGKKVAYASNKTFAEVNAGCTNTAGQEGSGSAYILKKVNGSWVVVTVGQGEDPAMTKLYGIPSNFQ